MKKWWSDKQKIIVSLLISIFLVGILIFATGFNITGENMTGDVIISQSCTDSDGGDDIYTKGSVTYTQVDRKKIFRRKVDIPTSKTYTDSCVRTRFAKRKLIEYYCVGGTTVASRFATCLYGCSDDACKPAPLCTPNCAEKTCGSNGCGGSCGTCNIGQTCVSNGVCKSDLEIACINRGGTWNTVWSTCLVKDNSVIDYMDLFNLYLSDGTKILNQYKGADKIIGTDAPKVRFMSGISRGTVLNGPETIIGGKKVNASINDVNAAWFTIGGEGGETTTKLAEGDTYKFSDGSYLGVIDITYATDGLKQATIYLGDNKEIILNLDGSSALTMFDETFNFKLNVTSCANQKNDCPIKRA